MVTDQDVSRIAAEVERRTRAAITQLQGGTNARIVAIAAKVNALAASDIDADELAAALADDLGPDLGKQLVAALAKKLGAK